MKQPECDGARQGDYCTGGIVRHIWVEPFADTQWLCVKHYKEWEAARERKQTQGNRR